MIEVSEKLKTYLLRTGRTFKAKIVLRGSTEPFECEILNIFADKSSCADELTVGAVNISFVEISLFNCSVNIAGQEITVFIGTEIDDTDEWIKIGVFTAEKPQTEDAVITFKAYDCIKYKTNNTYFPSFEDDEEKSVNEVFADVCNYCDVPFVPLLSEDTLKIDPKKLSGYKCNYVLGQIAGFMGGNLICNNEGKVTVKTFSECDYEFNEDMFATPIISEDLFTVQGIVCKTGDGSVLTIGNQNKNCIEIENGLMTQNRLNEIFNQLKNISYKNIKVQNIVGNPCIEAGDIITMKYGGIDYKMPVMHISVDFDGGVGNDIESYAKTVEEKEGGKESLSVKVEEIEKSFENINRDTSEFSQAINAALGLYASKQPFPDGSVKYFFHDAETLATSTYIYTSTSEGIAFTYGGNCWNNGNPNWSYGLQKEGNAILNYLIANKITANMINTESLFAKDIIASGVLKSLQQDDKSRLIYDFANGEIRTDYDGGMFDGDNVLNLSNKRFRYTRTVTVDGVEYQDYVALQPNGLLIQRMQGLKTVKEYNLNFGAFGEGFDSFFTNLRVGQIAVSDFYYSKDWTALSLSNGVKAVSGGGFTEPKYRAFGDRIDIQGAVQFNSNGTTAVHIATLPSGYRPNNTIYFAPYVFDTANSGYNYSRGYINSDGKIFFQWAYKINDGTPITINNTKAQINCSFYL